MVDFIADCMENIREREVVHKVRPGYSKEGHPILQRKKKIIARLIGFKTKTENTWAQLRESQHCGLCVKYRP